MVRRKNRSIPCSEKSRIAENEVQAFVNAIRSPIKKNLLRLTEQALKQNDWYTKHALRKLLAEHQEALQKSEKQREIDVLQFQEKNVGEVQYFCRSLNAVEVCDSVLSNSSITLFSRHSNLDWIAQ